MIERIIKIRGEVIKKAYNPDYVVMNELDLRRLKDSLPENSLPEIYGVKDSWRKAIGGKLLGMVVVFDPDCEGIKILYGGSEEKE